MYQLKLMLFTAFMLIQLCGYSESGRDSSKIVVFGQDTLALVPIAYINAANAVKVMNDLQSDILLDMQSQIRDLKEVKKVQDIQIYKLSKGLTKEHDALTESELKVTALTVHNYHYKKALFITVGVAVIEAFGIYLLVHK